MLRSSVSLRAWRFAARVSVAACLVMLPASLAHAGDGDEAASSGGPATVRHGDDAFRAACYPGKALQAGISAAQPARIAYRVHGGEDTGIYATANDCHLFALPGKPRSDSHLFVFLGGTHSKPYAYQQILRVASENNQYAVSIRYPDDVAVDGESACLYSTDANCTNDFRKESVDGVDSSDKIEVDRRNSIAQRLRDFLADRGGPWKQFLLPSGEADWSKIVVAGHSQGSGDALFIASTRKVLRAVAFSGVSDRAAYPDLSEPADWLVHKGWSTPADSLYALSEKGDSLGNSATKFDLNGNPCVAQEPESENDYDHYADQCHVSYQSWGVSRMTDYPSHVFTGYASPAKESATPGLAEHNATVVDAYTPMNNGRPVYQDVWEMMAFKGLP